jgi:hypothetical protein
MAHNFAQPYHKVNLIPIKLESRKSNDPSLHIKKIQNVLQLAQLAIILLGSYLTKIEGIGV